MSEPAVTTNHWPPRRIVAGTFVVCAVAGVFALLVLVRHVLFLLFIAIVLSTALAPLVAWLTRRGLPRNLSISAVFALLLAALVAPGVIGLPLLVDQGQSLLHSLPESYEEFRQKIGQVSPTIAARLPEQPAWVHREDEVIEGALATMSKALSYSGLLLHGGFLILVVILMSFLWSIHEEHTIRSMLLFLPPDRRAEAGEVVEGIETKVGAYVRGQGLLCLAVGSMSLVAYLVIGLPHALALALVAGILEAVPVFGPVLGAVPPLLVALSVDPTKIMWVLVAAIAIQQSENYLLVPRIMDRSVGVNAVVTLLAIAGFSALEGLAGAVLAIPMAAIIQLLLDRYVLGPEALEPERPANHDAIGRLRFETQELIKQVRLQTREKDDPMSSRSDRVEETIETIAKQLDEALRASAPGRGSTADGGSVMRQLAVTTAVILATLVVLAVLWELRGAVLIFFLSLGTSAALRRAIDRLHAWGLPKTLALALTYLGCVVAFAGLAVALLFPLAADVQKLGRDFRDAYQKLSGIGTAGNPLERAIASRLPSWDDLEHISWGVNSTDLLPTADRAPGKEATNPATAGWWTTSALQTVLGATWGFFGTLLNVLIIVVLSLYWSIDRVHFERLWLSLLDVDRRQRARETWRAVEQATGAYLQREAGQSLAAGLMLGSGFWMFGQPYPVLSAAIGALAWLIPWVGAPLAMLCVTAIWLPTFFLAGGDVVPLSLLAAALYTLLVLLLLEWLVEPRLFRRKRYNPILLVVVAVGMVDWLGLLGLLIAPPVAAAIQIIGGQFLAQRTAPAGKRMSPRELAERVATLRARLADAEDVSDETTAAVARLEALVERARGILDPRIERDGPT